LGPAGVLARSWPGFEPRPGQLDMAQAVARALEGRSKAVVEAGTGIGKTLAYLVPVFVSGQKTILSTATKNLQDQLVDKDLPFLAETLGLTTEVCLVKGRLNYLCRRKLEKGLAQGRLDPWTGQKLAAWAQVSQTGDRAEVDFLPEEDPLWARLTSSSEECLGQDCEFFGQCFITWLRRRAGRARLVVANHHLFMADLALRQSGFGQVLPESEAVVFDEAHELEEAATSHFSVSISNLKIVSYLKDLAEAWPAFPAPRLTSLQSALNDLFKSFLFKAERTALGDDLLREPVLDKGHRLIDQLTLAGAEVRTGAQDEAQARSLALRAESLADGLRMILGRLEPDYVYFAERLKRGLNLKAAPVETAGLLSRVLFSQPRAFVLTSASLDPDRFRVRLGLGQGVEELRLASPFDFAAMSLLYVPARLTLPHQPGFAAAVADQMEALVNISRGRAFLLFTSRRNLEAVHKLLAPRLAFPVLKQGQAPKAKLIEDFLEQEGSVLMATASFWQGVDIAGPSLSLVAIDKLPFAPPEDPLVAARIGRLTALGQDPFKEYQLPEASLSLRQGLGRLIRSKADSGLLAVLDVRLVTKSYGQTILKELPPSPLVRDLAQVARWAEKRFQADRSEGRPG